MRLSQFPVAVPPGDRYLIDNVHFAATALPTAPVPEPGALALLGLGLLGLRWARRPRTGRVYP